MDVESPGGRSGDTEPELEMQIQVSNIWFGRLRMRPQEPMLLSEKGFTMRLSKNGAGNAMRRDLKKSFKSHFSPIVNHFMNTNIVCVI